NYGILAHSWTDHARPAGRESAVGSLVWLAAAPRHAVLRSIDGCSLSIWCPSHLHHGRVDWASGLAMNRLLYLLPGGTPDSKSNAASRLVAAASRGPSGARPKRHSMSFSTDVVSYTVWST